MEACSSSSSSSSSFPEWRHVRRRALVQDDSVRHLRHRVILRLRPCYRRRHLTHHRHLERRVSFIRSISNCTFKAVVRSVFKSLQTYEKSSQVRVRYRQRKAKDKPVGFYGPIAPPFPNAPSFVSSAPELRSLHAAAPPVQSEYPADRRTAAAVPLPESP